MSDLTTTIVSAIQHHHRAATAAAGVAIRHAIEAGRLLIEAKAAMPHGDFGPWVESECGIGYRTARRYMRAAAKWGAMPETEWPAVANLAKALTGLTPATPRAPGGSRRSAKPPLPTTAAGVPGSSGALPRSTLPRS